MISVDSFSNGCLKDNNEQSLTAHSLITAALCGPVARRRILWFAGTYALIASLGISMSWFGGNVPLQVIGLGLVFPGGGFLAHADIKTLQGLVHIGMALFSLAGFAVAMLAWFATGNVLAPPLVWLFFAVAAVSMGHLHHVSPNAGWGAATIAAGLFVISGLIALVLWRRGIAERKQLNSWLQEEAPAVAASLKKAATQPPRELSPDDVKRMRFLLDRALQPVEQFNGFEWLDQFQTAAVRYQLNFIGYALAMAQYTHLPACAAYINEAQRRLITKLSDHRIWRYWALENAWGNLRFNPDPVARENIMYTGFCAAQMAMYHAASGRREYDEPGSFTLQHPSGKRWEHSLPELVRVLEQKMDESDYHLIACEPNWIYPLCNTIGASAMQANNPDVWARQQERFRHALEQEFMTLSGQIVPGRSRYTGFALPVMGGAMVQSLPCLFLNALMPDIALRQWLLLRRQIMDGDRIRRNQFWRIDMGNYRFSRATAYGVTALAAAEFGDHDVHSACLAALDAECPVRTGDGFFYRPQASLWAHAIELFARCNRTDGFRTMITSPRGNTRSPHISSASYPDVLMASAICDGGKLHAVLYNGTENNRQAIGIGGLEPHTAYRCRGAEGDQLMADADGNATVYILLDGRTEFELYKLV